jgi:hypothetical protein
MAQTPVAVNLAEKFGLFAEHWQPRVVGELNGQHVKLVKLLGAFVWHHHADEDELFLVVRGSLRMQFRGGEVTVGEGEVIVVPRGVEHRPVADEERENAPGADRRTSTGSAPPPPPASAPTTAPASTSAARPASTARSSRCLAPAAAGGVRGRSRVDQGQPVPFPTTKPPGTDTGIGSRRAR